MSFLSNIPWYLEVAVVFLTMMTVLVAAHEYGHYLFARMFGMGVEEFAIGMGKKLTVWRRKTYPVDGSSEVQPTYKENELGEPTAAPVVPTSTTETTDFTIRALPVGGFVRIKGMQPQEDGGETRIPGGFYSKAPWKRFLVLLAGPLFSVLAGILTLVPVFYFFGEDKPNPKPIIGEVLVNGVAAKAGLKAGDEVESIDGKPISSFYQPERFHPPDPAIQSA